MSQIDISRDTQDAQARFPTREPPILNFLLVKLAARCNIKCTYCYWFRDADVYKKPATLTLDSEQAFCRRLEEHIKSFALEEFVIIFHGGEPLLFPKQRFIDFQHRLSGIAERTGCAIQCGITTNATLIDAEWAKILRDHAVDVTISLDGPPDIHDKNRIGFKGEGTYADTLRGVQFLRAAGIEPGLIAVCDPSTDPERVLSHVVDDLGISRFNILPPDAKHGDDPPPISDYFIKLFDAWYDRYAARGVRISTLDSMVRGLSGGLSLTDTIGIGETATVTLMTDGSLEALDVLRIIGDGSTRSDTNIHKNKLHEVQSEPRWRAIFDTSLKLCDQCLKCEYLDACGGGHLSQRWSPERNFDNPSVYCDSWKRIFDHLWQRMAPTLILGERSEFVEQAIDVDQFPGSENESVSLLQKKYGATLNVRSVSAEAKKT
jgi:uncharacterized protein